MKIPKKIKKEIDHLKKTGIPRCQVCKKNFINAKDTKTGKINKYVWKANCKCISSNLRLMRG